jgi:hypothetical protein
MLRLKFLLPALCLSALLALPAAALKAGAGVRVITPKKLMPISGGVGTPEPATGVQGDLFARAIAFEDGDTRIAIVSLDCLGFPGVLGDQVRAKVEGIPGTNILIGATHTHSGPDLYAFPDGKGGHNGDMEYIAWVVDETAAAINEAVKNLEPAALKIAVGEAKGKIAYNYYAPELYDPRCGIIQAVDPEAGKVIATLVNYASHPEVMGTGRNTISPDFCGPLYDRIEAATGAMAMFMNGAQGGMVTADCRGEDGEDVQTWDECIRIGNLLADEALRIVKDAPLQESPALYCASERLEFPITSPLILQLFGTSGLDYSSVSDGENISTQMNLINLGTAQLVNIPGEALPNIGYYLKRKMPTEHPFLLGLTNDAFGYILTKEDFESFKRYDYVSRTSLGEQTGPILVDSILAMVAKHPQPAKP